MAVMCGGDCEVNGKIVRRLKCRVTILVHSGGLGCSKVTVVRTLIYIMFAMKVCSL